MTPIECMLSLLRESATNAELLAVARDAAIDAGDDDLAGCLAALLAPREHDDSLGGALVALPCGLEALLCPDGTGSLHTTDRETVPGWAQCRFGPGERHPDALSAWLEYRCYYPEAAAAQRLRDAYPWDKFGRV